MVPRFQVSSQVQTSRVHADRRRMTSYTRGILTDDGPPGPEP